jgi:hypothetical protein
MPRSRSLDRWTDQVRTAFPDLWRPQATVLALCVAFPKKPERRLECTLMACWEEGYEEPWFLVADLAPDQAEGLRYGMRSWIEQGYKLLKSGDWQWQSSASSASSVKAWRCWSAC